MNDLNTGLHFSVPHCWNGGRLLYFMWCPVSSSWSSLNPLSPVSMEWTREPVMPRYSIRDLPYLMSLCGTCRVFHVLIYELTEILFIFYICSMQPCLALAEHLKS